MIQRMQHQRINFGGDNEAMIGWPAAKIPFVALASTSTQTGILFSRRVTCVLVVHTWGRGSAVDHLGVCS